MSLPPYSELVKLKAGNYGGLSAIRILNALGEVTSSENADTTINISYSDTAPNAAVMSLKVILEYNGKKEPVTSIAFGVYNIYSKCTEFQLLRNDLYSGLQFTGQLAAYFSDATETEPAKLVLNLGARTTLSDKEVVRVAAGFTLNPVE